MRKTEIATDITDVKTIINTEILLTSSETKWNKGEQSYDMSFPANLKDKNIESRTFVCLHI